MRYLYYFVAILALLAFVSGCNNGEHRAEDSNKEIAKKETDDKSNENDITQILSIGETGLIKSTLGDFKVTPESIESITGETVYGKLIKATIKLTNVSDKALNIYDINDSRIIPQTEDIMSKYEDVEITEQVEEIPPNESVILKITFDTFEDSKYHLVFGNEYVSNEIHWEFDLNQK